MDLYNLVISAKLSKGEGGDVSVDPLSVTENGVYTASSGHAYSPVTVDVPNSYSASDEGKVVSNGALVGQTSATKTANGTYDTTLNNEIVVNVPTVTPTGNVNITSTAQTDVSAYATAQVVDADLVAGNIKKDVNILGVVGTYEGGGGGGSSYTLLHEEDDEVTASSQVVTVKTITLSEFYTSDLLFVRIRDKAGRRQGYFLESEAYIANPNPKNGTTSDFYTFGRITIYDDGGTLKIDSGQYGGFGVYATNINSNGNLTIQARPGRGNVDGTYRVEVYKLALPDGSSSPFPTV